MNGLQPKDWRFGLCGCTSASFIINCLACCCPSIRWADTMRMAGLYTFWIGVVIFAGLYLLNPYTAGLTFLMLLVVVTWQRQELRKRFGLQTGGVTYCVDCLTYLCCMCCAIVQEAQQMEEAYAVQHPALERPPMAYKLRAEQQSGLIGEATGAAGSLVGGVADLGGRAVGGAADLGGRAVGGAADL